MDLLNCVHYPSPLWVFDAQSKTVQHVGCSSRLMPGTLDTQSDRIGRAPTL